MSATASALIQSRMTLIAKERGEAIARLNLAETSKTEATNSIARLDAEKAALETALAQLGA